ncbi:MAG: ribonuclease Y [Kofleriaceae bacterium]|nr:ribonuclease Y [Kofleriaceae bacterium]MBP6837113.1 ribonuclease Y [Kofleriaceae bacterium]
MTIALVLAGVLAGLLVGAVLGRVLGRGQPADAGASAAEAAAEIKKLRAAADAEVAELRRAGQVEREEQAEKLRGELEADLAQRKQELGGREEALSGRERELDRSRRDADRRASELDKKEKSTDGRAKQIDAVLAKAEAAQTEATRKLEEVARLSEAEARKRLEDEVRSAALAGVAGEIKRIEDEAEREASARAKTIVAAAIQRYASEFVHERTVAVVPLPSDDLKGRLIGREGRNIRALEAATGIDIIIDDSSEALTISCFNPVRREIARLAIAALVADGRIHPTRIEEVVRKAEKDVDKVCKEAGEQAVFDLGLHRVHPELVRALGRLKFRQSYAQNLLIHSIEVGYLAGLMAAELGQNVKLARRAGLLHDLGKSVDHEQEGAHAEVGAQLARRHGESPKVCQAIAAHHGEVAAATVLDHVVAAANALSAARPGARREQLASYIKRLEDLEALCTGHPGVERAYALQSGREIRVMVENDKVDDGGALMLSKELARKIEHEATYAGQVRVVVLRETRASEYAR